MLLLIIKCLGPIIAVTGSAAVLLPVVTPAGSVTGQFAGVALIFLGGVVARKRLFVPSSWRSLTSCGRDAWIARNIQAQSASSCVVTRTVLAQALVREMRLSRAGARRVVDDYCERFEPTMPLEHLRHEAFQAPSPGGVRELLLWRRKSGSSTPAANPAASV